MYDNVKRSALITRVFILPLWTLTALTQCFSLHDQNNDSLLFLPLLKRYVRPPTHSIVLHTLQLLACVGSFYQRKTRCGLLPLHYPASLAGTIYIFGVLVLGSGPIKQPALYYHCL